MYPEREFIVFEDQRYTFRTAHERAVRTAAVFRVTHGIRKGEYPCALHTHSRVGLGLTDTQATTSALLRGISRTTSSFSGHVVRDLRSNRFKQRTENPAIWHQTSSVPYRYS